MMYMYEVNWHVGVCGSWTYRLYMLKNVSALNRLGIFRQKKNAGISC